MRVKCPQGHGELLSNTWTTCPRDVDKPGKLGIIRDSCGILEWLHGESSGARGWVCAYQVVVGVTYLLAYDGYGL